MSEKPSRPNGGRLKWCRIHSEALHDPKLLQLRPEVRWYWTGCVLIANQNCPRGVLPCLSEIALALRLKPSRAQKVIDQLVNAKLIDRDASGVLSMHNWGKWQAENEGASRAHASKRGRARPQARSETEIEIEEENCSLHSQFRAGEREECEPFQSPIEPRREEPPLAPVENPPERVRAVQAKAERLFPMLGLDRFVGELKGEFPADWLEHALDEAHQAGIGDPPYLRGILRRYARTGGPRAAPSRASPCACRSLAEDVERTRAAWASDPRFQD